MTRTSFAIGIVGLALIAACNGGAPPPPDPLSALLGPPNPRFVTASFDGVNAVSQVVTADGGTILLPLPNGAQALLTVPAGALAVATELTLQPMETLEDAGIAANALAGIALLPASVQFMKPATLVLAAAAKPSGTQLQAFTLTTPSSPAAARFQALDLSQPTFEIGLEVSLPPCVPPESGLLEALQIQVSQSGVFGMVPVSPEELETLIGTVPTDICQRIDNALNTLATQVIASGPTECELPDELLQLQRDLLALAYTDLIKPVMDAALADPRLYPDAEELVFYCWMPSALAVAPSVDSGDDPGFLSLIGDAWQAFSQVSIAALNDADARCDAHDLTSLVRMSEIYQLALGGFIGNHGIPEDVSLASSALEATIAGCAQFRVEATATAGFTLESALASSDPNYYRQEVTASFALSLRPIVFRANNLTGRLLPIFAESLDGVFTAYAASRIENENDSQTVWTLAPPGACAGGFENVPEMSYVEFSVNEARLLFDGVVELQKIVLAFNDNPHCARQVVTLAGVVIEDDVRAGLAPTFLSFVAGDVAASEPSPWEMAAPGGSTIATLIHLEETLLPGGGVNQFIGESVTAQLVHAPLP